LIAKKIKCNPRGRNERGIPRYEGMRKVFLRSELQEEDIQGHEGDRRKEDRK
jgi:hypothetical protein